MSNHGLSPRTLRTIAEVLRQSSASIEEVALYGSRATGRWRPNSDVDLVLYGYVSPQEVDRMWTRFHESLLPLRVEAVAYQHLRASLARCRLDAAARTLFTRDQLYRNAGSFDSQEFI